MASVPRALSTDASADDLSGADFDPITGTDDLCATDSGTDGLCAADDDVGFPIVGPLHGIGRVRLVAGLPV